MVELDSGMETPTNSAFHQKLKSSIKYLNPARNFKTKLLFCFVTISVLEIALGLIFVRYVTLTELENNAQKEIGMLASQMAARMDRFMWERYQQVLLLADNFNDIDNIAELRGTLNAYCDSYSVYSFFGIVDMNGTVVASGRGLLENVSVAARPWFIEGKAGPYVGDVHLAKMLQSILGGSEILRFVDVAGPIRNKMNQTIAVLGSHLSWTWAQELSDAIFNKDDIKQSREIFVVSSDSTVILTPKGYPFNASEPYKLNLDYPAISHSVGYGIMKQKWPVVGTIGDEKEFIIGVSISSGYNDYPGLGWHVLLRQPVEVAYSKAHAMYYLIIIAGICMMVVFIVVAVVLAWQLTRPIMDVVKAADRILTHISSKDKRPENDELKHMSNRMSVGSEVRVLFSSLQSLVSALDEQAQLTILNSRLQADVLDYTEKLVKSTQDLEDEKTDKALVQGILFNVLPSTVAERLKIGERILADNYPDLTIFFSDIVGFTPLCEKLAPVEVVMFLDDIFSRMDALTAEFDMDRIRTIGDSYFAVGGMKNTSTTQQHHTAQVLSFAYCVLQLLDDFNKAHALEGIQLQFRMGIHCGPCVGSVIGTKQVSFDLWGDAINVASRMESTGEAGRVQVSQQVYQRTKHLFNYEKWDAHEVKGRGMMVTYFLKGPREDLQPNSCPPISHIGSVLSTSSNSVISTTLAKSVSAGRIPY